MRMMHRFHIISLLLCALLNQGALVLAGGTGPASLQYRAETVTINTDRDFYIAGERVYFRLDISNRYGAPASSIAYLVIRNQHNKVIERASLIVEDKMAKGSIYLPDTLSTSYYQLVAFTNLMRNFPEEYYAFKQIVAINRFDDTPYESLLPGNNDRTGHQPYNGGNKGPAKAEPTAGISPATGSPAGISPATGSSRNEPLRISMPRKIAGTREMFEVEIESLLPDNNPAILTISVAQSSSFADVQRSDDAGGSGTRVPDRNPGINEGTAAASTRGITGTAGAGSRFALSSWFFKETNGPVLTGRVQNRINGEGIPGATVILSVTDTALNLLYAITDNNGIFHYRLNDYHDGRQLWFSLYNEGDNPDHAEIVIDDRYSLRTPFISDTGRHMIPGREHILASRDIVRVNKILGIDHNLHKERVGHGYRPVIYSAPAYTLETLREYEYLENLQEIARELIPFLRIRRQGDLYTSIMMLRYEDTYLQDTPAYFIDGIYAGDFNNLVYLDSDAIERIELHNYYWRHGNILFPGIVALFSTGRHYRDIEPAGPTATTFQHPAADHSSYGPPDHAKVEMRRSRPDFRQLLFWDPAFTIGPEQQKKTARFFTSDLKGEFTVKVRGFTGNGKIISQEARFVVADEEAAGTSGGDSRDGGLQPGNEIPPALNTPEGTPCNTEERDGTPTVTPANEIHLDDTEKFFEQGLSGRLTPLPRRPIGDQHYPDEEWHRGSVVLNNGTEVKNKLLRYNGYLDELFWLHEGDYQQVQVDKDMIKEFRIPGPEAGKLSVYRRININAPVLAGNADIFGELLHEGDISVYAWRRIIETTRDDQRIGEIIYGGMRIKPAHIYIIRLPDDTVHTTRRISRRRILDMFPENRREIRRLLREHRMRPATGQDLVETALILEEYLRE